jgi:hypothetical protein
VIDVDDRIDALYRLPLTEFTAARTQLARTVAGADAAAVKALKKPTTIPWAVNQLYWKDRRTYQRLLDSGRALRTAQIAALEGRKADVRGASETHRAAVADAAAKAVHLAASAGVKTTAEALARMLEAVSLSREQPDHPGRFTDPLQPAAFDALAGITPRLRQQPPHEPAHHAVGTPGRDAHQRGTRTHETAAQRRAREAEARRLEQQAREQQHALEAAVARSEHADARAQKALASARERLARAERDAESAVEALGRARADLDAFKSRS